jgi:hypothetical protein
MAKAFTDECSRESEIRETLMLILAEADPGYMTTVNLGQFEQGLIDEVHFLLPGDEEDMQHVEHYIRTHGEELYQIALASTAQRRAAMAL